jgi:hypothetical protein
VTLGRLLLAWLPVALWFALADLAGRKLQRRFPAWPAGNPPDAAMTTRGLAVRSLEAVVVTLFASLWFDSLGHGGWWLLFLLVGVLAAGLPRRPGLVPALVDVLRYVAAGAILAWRLG